MPTGYKDVIGRFRVGIGPRWFNAATRLVQRATGYKDASTRYNLILPRYKDAGVRFRMQWSGGRLRTWNGAAWIIPKQLEQYTGGSWGLRPIKLWSGGRWVTVLEANRWSILGLTNQPLVQYRTASCVLNSALHIIGGLDEAANETDRHQQYTPATDTWITRAVLPAVRSEGGADVIGGLIYFTGGSSGGTANVEQTLWSYDPNTNAWTAKLNMPTKRRRLAVVALSGLLYAIGGENSSGTAVATVEQYTPGSNTWAAKASLPVAASSARAVAFNGLLYCTAGGSSANFYSYNPGTNTWTALAALPSALSRAALVVSNGAIFAFNTTTLYRYDVLRNTWTTLAVSPTDNDTPNYGLVLDVLYVFKGDVESGIPVFNSMKFGV